MKSIPCKLVPASHLILKREDKVLLIRRFNTGFKDGSYSVPAGLLDGNETFLEAAAREAKEEIGINLNVNDLEVVHVIHRRETDREWIDFFIFASQWQGEPKNMESQKCDGLDWFKVDNLPSNVILYVKQAIENISEGIFYSEYGW